MTEGYLLDPLYIDFSSTFPVCCSVFYKLGRILSSIRRTRIPVLCGLKYSTSLPSLQCSASMAQQVTEPQLSASSILPKGTDTDNPSGF